MNIGIYQGRLTNSKVLQKFPKNWIKEFKYAKSIGYDHIEFFLEKKINPKNPIWIDKKKIIKNIKTMKNKRAIICDNYLIYNSLLKDKNINYIVEVIEHISKLPKPKLIIPLNKSLLKKKSILIANLNKVLKYAKKFKVEISFECEFDSQNIVNLSKKINRNFKITFDTGNVFLMEKNINNSFHKLRHLINHIHIKDRNKLKKNTVFGSGLINFKSFFKLIKKINYKNDLTLETNRGDNAIITGQLNLTLLKKLI